MKKAKLFLTAAAVVAVVGGAFALKAHRNGNNDIYFCNTVAQACQLSDFSTQSGGAPINLPTDAEYYQFGSTTTSCTAASPVCGTTALPSGASEFEAQ